MEPADALAELIAASPAVEAAAVFDGDEQLGSVGVSASAATVAMRAARALLADAGEFRGVGEPTQVYASLEGGDVFVVGTVDGPAILAVTSAGQPSGLVFHELKRCLASLALTEARQ